MRIKLEYVYVRRDIFNLPFLAIFDYDFFEGKGGLK